MKTSTFIEKHKLRIDNNEPVRRGHVTCASVMATDDRIYSYGYHYPLLFQIETASGRKLWVCNDGGYSVTTSKHISHCRGLADIYAPIGGQGSSMTAPTVTRDTVIDALEREIQSLANQMLAKKRKDTQVYSALDREHSRLVLDLHSVKYD